MKLKGLQIEETQGDYLTVKLEDILACFEDGKDLTWSILWIEGIGKSDDKLDVLRLEKTVNDADSPILFSWKELVVLANRFNQIINVILIGDWNSVNIKRYQEGFQMYLNCEFTIELVDSSYWLIHSKSSAFLTKLSKSLTGVRVRNID